MFIWDLSDEQRKGQAKRELLGSLRQMYLLSDKCFGINQMLPCVRVGRHLELMETFPPYLLESGRLEAEELSSRSRRG